MAIDFAQYPLMVSPGNANLNKTKTKASINFKLKFQYILFYVLLA